MRPTNVAFSDNWLRPLSLIILLNICLAAPAQELSWKFQETESDASLRGLSVVDENVVWASGSGGTVLKTDDAGENWQIVSPKGSDELDFRDVHAFDANNAVIINAGQPAAFYRTTDGGQSWSKVFQHANESAFFDAVAAISSEHLIAMSDPIDDRILLVESKDSGATWTELAAERRPLKQPGEAGFAASGSNMITDSEGNIYLALGSAEEGTEHKTSRIMVSTDAAQTWKPIECPINRNPSSGIFSLSYLPNRILISVGGNYLEPEQRSGTCAITVIVKDVNHTILPKKGPGGFRSGVTYTQLPGEKFMLVAVGTNGSDFSLDHGATWRPFSDEGFHAVKSTGSGTVWTSGAKGRIGKLVIDQTQQ